jgi:hypothetical protein
MPLHPGPDTHILRISRLRVTYEQGSSKISRHFHCSFENTNGYLYTGFGSFYLDIQNHIVEYSRV